MTVSQLDLASPGFLAGSLQHTPQKIKAAADKLGIFPAMTINGIPYYTSGAADEIAAELAKHTPTQPARGER